MFVELKEILDCKWAFVFEVVFAFQVLFAFPVFLAFPGALDCQRILNSGRVEMFLPALWKSTNNRPLVVPSKRTPATSKQDGKARCQADDEGAKLDSNLLGGKRGGRRGKAGKSSTVGRVGRRHRGSLGSRISEVDNASVRFDYEDLLCSRSLMVVNVKYKPQVGSPECAFITLPLVQSSCVYCVFPR